MKTKISPAVIGAFVIGGFALLFLALTFGYFSFGRSFGLSYFSFGGCFGFRYQEPYGNQCQRGLLDLSQRGGAAGLLHHGQRD